MRFSYLSDLSEDQERYRWVIVVAGFFGLLASLGLGRFSLGMMLPSMGDGLELSYAQMGLISTMNFCGYLAAVLVCGRLGAVVGARLLIWAALLLVGGSMVLIGLSSSLVSVIVLYCCTGVGSALSNVPIMALISTWFEPARRGRAAGLCIMGNGFGILLSGQVVPWLGTTGRDWRVNWLVLGGLVILIAFICLLLIRNEPARHGAPAGVTNRSGEGLRAVVQRVGAKTMLYCAAIYLLFGFTYVIYITFMVTSLVEERGLSEHAAGELWSLVGLISLGSGPLFGYLSDKVGRKSGLIVVFAIQTVAYVLAGMKLPMISVFLSITLFALVAFSVPTIIAALVGDYASPQGAATAFGLVTFVFGIGQVAGPAVAGVLAEQTGSFATSFLMAGMLTLTALILSSRLPPRSPEIS